MVTPRTAIPRSVILAAELACAQAYASAQVCIASRVARSVSVAGVPLGTHLAAALIAAGFRSYGPVPVWLWRPTDNVN